MSIPKFIHQLWISPRSALPDLPERVRSDTAKWKLYHKDFSYKIWSLDEVLELARTLHFGDFTGEQISQLIRICRFPAMQADLARLLLLYQFGGIWVDLKLVPIRSFLSELLLYDLFLVEHQKGPKFPDPAKFGILNNWFFGCIPHSRFIRMAAELALQNVTNRIEGVWEVTGPRVFMTIVEKEFPKAFENSYPGFRLIRADDYMDVLVGYGWGSYNDGGMHWSERLKREPVYDERKE